MMRKWFHFFIRCVTSRYIPLVVIALFLCLADNGWARAGGGEGYASRSDGGSGDGGNGVGVIEILFFVKYWFIFVARYPVIGIPLTIAAVYLLYRFVIKPRLSQGGASPVENMVNGIKQTVASRVQDPAEQAGMLRALQSQDAGFDATAFCSRVQQAFILIQQGWSKQDMRAATPFISDGIAERFALQFAEQKRKGIRNEMDQVHVDSCTVAQVSREPAYDVITCCIEASAEDTYVDLNSGKKIGGEGRSRFTEFWTFIRKPGAQTKNDKGLIEGHCPNCGTLLELNLYEKCSSCGAMIKSGAYDWVLSEITQPEEWVVKTPETLPGVAELQKKDPAFSVQQLEDRSSVIFWRWVQSQQSGDIAALRKMADDACCETVAKTFQPSGDGVRHYFGDCAVGAVDLHGLLSEDGGTLALVTIRWSGANYIAASSGPKKTAEPHIIQQTYVLYRQAGVITADEAGLSSAHCPNCGAAIGRLDDNACEYCQTVLNTGATDWVLHEILYPYDAERKTYFDRLSIQ